MSCAIILENYNEYYIPGAKIIGRVQCNFDDSTVLRCIKIELEREEYNQWNERGRYGTFTYIGQRKVAIIETIIYGTEDGNHHFSTGSHDFPFVLVLPENLPSFYVGPHSLITYHLKVVVDRPRSANYETSLFVNIIAPLFLQRIPIEELAEKTIIRSRNVPYWCCRSGKISMDVTMPRMVFVRGDTMDVEIRLMNLSNYRVRQLCVSFEKVITLKVTDPTSRKKILKEKFFQTIEHGVGAHDEHTYNISIPIPTNLEILNFTDCKLMKVHYLLLIKACLGRFISDFKMKIYPKVANIRVLGISEGAPESSPQTPDLTVTTAPRLEIDLPSYQSLVSQDSPPPTYNSVVTDS